MIENEFQSWLEKGLGRAILFLRDHDDAPYREQIAHACAHNMAFDRQIEGRCAAYYYDLITATKNRAYYRDRLLASMLAPLESEYPYQMFAIAGLLAASGDEGARAAMYAAFALSGKDDIGRADLLVELDGYAGLQFVSEHRPEVDAEAENYGLDDCVEILEARYGEENAWFTLEGMAAENSTIAAWLEIVRKTRAKSKATREAIRPHRPGLSYLELKNLIAEKGRKLNAKARFWHDKANPEEFDLAARDLLTETDADRLVPYLRIFSKCGFPLDPAPIIALADSEDATLSWEALRTLENTKHPAVRAFALTCLESSRHLHYVVGMLDSNYEPGDEATIANLTALKMDSDDYHHMQFCARDFVEEEWDEYCVSILLNVYENVPCSLCRYFCVKMLLEHNALPDWMRKEACYDADEDTRKLISGLSVSSSGGGA